jgi:hypothetical protein
MFDNGQGIPCNLSFLSYVILISFLVATDDEVLSTFLYFVYKTNMWLYGTT